eukprot:NODE_4_length_77007_cov_1.156642.p7 type:complete len:631 gc:universal NODE_4_length_77007_cov_1.156642:71545-73437(+)
MIAIGYASQTGTAEHISKHLKQELDAMGINCMVYPLEEYSKVPYNELQLHIFIVSSTGDGDCPEHTLPFYKWLRKLKKSKEPLLKGLKYCMLGLGDTNYTNFNGNAKKTLKFLKELECEPVFRNEMADDAVGLERFVDPFIDEVIQFVSNRAAVIKQNNMQNLVEETSRLSTRDAANKFDFNISTETFKPSRLPNHITWKTKGTRDPSIDFFHYKKTLVDKSDQICASTELTLIRGKCITQKNSIKKSYQMSIKANGCHFNAGDSITLFFPNPSKMVEDVLHIFGYTLANNPVILDGEYDDISLHDLLKYRLSFKFPSKRFLRLVSEYCKDDFEKKKLMYLTSKEGAREFNSLRDSNYSLFDVLSAFPSCAPPIYALGLLDILKPRHYSVVEFRQDQAEIDIVFNLKEFKVAENVGFGLATGYLYACMNESIEFEKVITLNQPILGLPAPTSTFTLDPHNPVVFIGPGSGVAPYLQFIKDLNFGQKALLIQGCRGPEDWILKKDLSEITKAREIPYFVAYSRVSACAIQSINDGVTLAENDVHKVGDLLGYSKAGAYVWDVINTYKELILEYFDEDAVFYLCGDANSMVKMFLEVMKIVISSTNHISMENASKIVEQMIKNKQIRLDVWG